MSELTIALAGNANVGKSVLFNALTGMHQHIGNWPGKTVERAEGTFFFMGKEIDVIDLPGIYSFSTYSIEETVSREYIAKERPDVVINVIDSTVLERNLFLTLQLLELGRPVVVALNQMDLAKSRGIRIDHKQLELELGVPVVPVVATKNEGITELLAEVLKVADMGNQNPLCARYREEIESKIKKLEGLFGETGDAYPPRWLAVKLLEGDAEIMKEVENANQDAARKAEEYASEIESLKKEKCNILLSSDRYVAVSKITKKVLSRAEYQRPRTDIIDHYITHRVWGCPIMLLSVLAIFYSIFRFGDLTSGIMLGWFEGSQPYFRGLLGAGLPFELFWSGLEGLVAGVTIALPYIIPFYIILSLVEDSGFLSRMAFLMDNLMHKIGLHGRAFIPMILGYGCNVPACLGCRIMERHREKLITAFLSTLVPCAARTVIIMGIAGAYVGFEWAVFLYIFNLAIIFVLGKVANRVLPGEPVGLILEMHTYRIPSLKIAMGQAWFRVEEFIKIAFPIIVASSIVVKALEMGGFLEAFSAFSAPVTSGWLGLPPVIGVILIFAILRKELALVMLAAALGTANFGAVLTPVQMMTVAIVSMLYIPCVATIAALKKEFGWKTALYISGFEVVFAIAVAGLMARLLVPFF